MLQIYFLSVVFDVFAGSLLAAPYIAEKIGLMAFLQALSENRPVRRIFALLSVVVGVLKLFVLAPNETVPILGDLLPAAAGIAVGVLLYTETPAEELRSASGWRHVLGTAMDYRIPAGLAGIAIGLLHFLVPQILFL